MNAPYETVNAMAARICGMKPAIEQSNKQTVIPPKSKLYEYQYTDGDGLVLDCHLEYEESEKASHDSPGEPESITLIYALVNGVDVANVLSEDVTTQIEEEALCSMEMDAWNSDYDKGEARYLDRMEAA